MPKHIDFYLGYAVIISTFVGVCWWALSVGGAI